MSGIRHQLRTDMAREALVAHTGLSGVTEKTQEENGVHISRITVETEAAAEMLGKPPGTYITIDADKDMVLVSDTVSSCIAQELAALIKDIEGHILVVGLGNRFVTPDSLGPRTVEKLYVTRHLSTFAPELAPSGMREVSAIVPGVLGITGLETREVVLGIVKTVSPAAVLCIDALCSSRVARITDAVQLNNSGILPGAGVGNRQQGLNESSLGVPVFALGVPTVVTAAAIARHTVRLIEQKTGVNDENASLCAFAGELIERDMGALIVTPKDIDALVEDASRRLANGINLALHGAQCAELGKLLLR